MIVFIPTKNEEKHILRAIKSARNLSNKIYVIDSQSNDATIEIANKENIQVLEAPKNISFAEKMNFVYQHKLFEGEYIFRHDADEIISSSDAKIILENIEKSNFKCFSLVRKLSFMGHKLNFGGIGMRSTRIAMANSIRYEKTPIDERLLTQNNEIKNINAVIYDCPVWGFNEWIAKHNKYSDIEANLIQQSKGVFKLDKPIKLKIYYLFPPLLRPFLYFIFRYIFLFGFLDKLPGLLFHLSHSLIYRLVVDIKIISLNLRKK